MSTSIGMSGSGYPVNLEVHVTYLVCNTIFKFETGTCSFNLEPEAVCINNPGTMLGFFSKQKLVLVQLWFDSCY